MTTSVSQSHLISELGKIIKPHFYHLDEMNVKAVKWFRRKGLLRGNQKSEEFRCRPWTSAAIDRGLGDSEITAHLLLNWIKEMSFLYPDLPHSSKSLESSFPNRKIIH